MNVALYDTGKRLTTTSDLCFEETYINIRTKEQRIYTNEEVATLPSIYPDHIHYNEWEIRRRSSERLINNLRGKNKPLKILEVGCGNGWLSATLAAIDNSTVTGVDINLTELKQASEVFTHKQNLDFIYGDIDKLTPGSFDIIVFAASIQYFPSLREIITTSLSLLNEGGEIHILDTHFYEDGKVEEAIERTKNYYASLGCNEMAGYYFHHTMSELKSFKYKLLNKGNSLINTLRGRNDPFTWIRINK